MRPAKATRADQVERRGAAPRAADLSPAELAALDAVAAAVRALPPGFWLTVDSDDGVLSFWRRVSPARSIRVGRQLRCKRVLCPLG
jgi:hypothetical protein